MAKAILGGLFQRPSVPITFEDYAVVSALRWPRPNFMIRTRAKPRTFSEDRASGSAETARHRCNIVQDELTVRTDLDS